MKLSGLSLFGSSSKNYAFCKKINTLQRVPERKNPRILFSSPILNLLDRIDEFDAPPPATSPEAFSGTWKKIPEQSDLQGLQTACDLVNLPWIFRRALFFLNTLQLKADDEHLTTTLKAGGIMDVKETYQWNVPSSHPRRDKRKGRHTGTAYIKYSTPLTTATPIDSLTVDVEFDNPYGGWCTDSFQLTDDGTVLRVQTDMKMKESGKKVSYHAMYKRI